MSRVRRRVGKVIGRTAVGRRGGRRPALGALLGAGAAGLVTLTVLTGCGDGAVRVPVSSDDASLSSASSADASSADASSAESSAGTSPDGSSTSPSGGPSGGVAGTLTADAVHATGTSLAVHSLSQPARTAVVEDATMLSGTEYCALKKLPATASACSDEFRIVYGGRRRTVKVSPSAVYFVNFPQGTCQGANFGCKVSAKEFAATAAQTGPVLADAVSKDGVIVAIAQTYHP